MTTIKIGSEKDFEKVIEAKFGVKCTIDNVKDLYDVTEKIYATKYAEADLPKDINRALNYSYCPTVHIEISKKNAYAMDEFFKGMKRGSFGSYCCDCTYLDSDEYWEYDSIDEVPSDKVDFTFETQLMEVNSLVEVVAKKLKELGEDTNLEVNWIFPDGYEGTILKRNGEEMGVTRGLVWNISDGNVTKPDGTLVIFGEEDMVLLPVLRFVFTELTVAQWKELCGVDIEVKI
jgi:hypothetical protein